MLLDKMDQRIKIVVNNGVGFELFALLSLISRNQWIYIGLH